MTPGLQQVREAGRTPADEATRNPGLVYGVYLSARPGSPQEPRHIGSVSFFGIEHLSRTDLDQDGPHGFRESFDITGHVEQIRAGNAWDEERVTVSFRPLGLRPGADADPRDAGPGGGRAVAAVASATRFRWACHRTVPLPPRPLATGFGAATALVLLATVV